MVTLSQHERDLLQTLEQCLSRAVARADGVTPADINRTKHQKLLYLAIDEFDLPVTYSWYLAGSLVESRTVSLETLADTPGTVSPESPSIPGHEETESGDAMANDTYEEADVAGDSDPASADMSVPDREIERAHELEKSIDEKLLGDEWTDDAPDETGEQSTAPTAPGDDDASSSDDTTKEAPDTLQWPSDEIDVSVVDCIDFLVDQLEAYALTSTDQFLIQFYHLHAPDRYQALYENCLHVRSTLRALTDELRAYITGDVGTVDIARHDEELGAYLTQVHLELRRLEHLRATSTAVIRSTDLIEDAVMMLQQRPLNELDQSHVQALEALQDFYFNWAWKYPALLISVDTATGPSASDVVSARRTRLETFEDELTAERSRVKSELADVGLVPTYEDYPNLAQTSTTERLTTLVNAYVTGRSTDE